MDSQRIKYEIQGTAEEVDQKLQALEASDKESETTTKVHKDAQSSGCLKTFGAIGVWALIAFGIVKVYESGASEWIWKGLCIFLVPPSLAILYGTFYFFREGSRAADAAKGDLDDDRYKLLQRLHKFVQLDCCKSTQFHYTLDFRSFCDNVFFERKERYGGMIFLPKGHLKYYCMPVATGRFKLRDGTAVKILVERHGRVKDYRKRGRSGKVKRKWKVKYTDLYRVDLKLPHTPTGVSEAAPSREITRYIASNKARKPSLKVQGNKVSAVFKHKTIHGPVPTDPALQLLAWVFACLNTENQSAA